MNTVIKLATLSMALTGTSCVTTMQLPDFNDREVGEKVTVITYERSGAAESTDPGCGEFILPHLPAMPGLPAVMSTSASSPDEVENILLSHIRELRNHVRQQNKIIAEAYERYRLTCE